MASTRAPYSLNRFVALAERESKRGKDISRLVPEVSHAVAALKRRRERYKADIRHLDFHDPLRQELWNVYQVDRNNLRTNRDLALEAALQEALEVFESALERGEFRWGVKKGKKVDGDRQTYSIDKRLATQFPMKQTAAIVRQLTQGTAAGRNSIVRALQHALDRKHTHAIYRLDIKAFYDSIPHNRLLIKLRQLPELDTITDTLVCQLLDEFKGITNEDRGVPQGVALSSQLAEFYLSGFDQTMRVQPGVLFYARYVDDIIVVLESAEDRRKFTSVALSELAELGLEQNENKTQEIDTCNKGNYPEEDAIEYLGYSFSKEKGCLKTNLTEKRKNRRLFRLRQSFDAWLESSPDSAKPNTGHDGLLVDRIRYLAGNTRLMNSKDNVAIGLYFSNSALDSDAEELEALDTELESFILAHSGKMGTVLRSKIGTISFRDAFVTRPFYRFNQRRVRLIMQAWKLD